MAIFNMIAGSGGSEGIPSSFGTTFVRDQPTYSYTLHYLFYDTEAQQLYGIWTNSSQLTIFRINDDDSLTQIYNDGICEYRYAACISDSGNYIYYLAGTSSNIALHAVKISSGAKYSLASIYCKNQSGVGIYEDSTYIYWCWNNLTDHRLRLERYHKTDKTNTNMINYGYTAGGTNAYSRLGDYPGFFMDRNGNMFLYSTRYFAMACYKVVPDSINLSEIDTSYLSHVSYYATSEQPAIMLPDKNGDPLLLGRGSSSYATFSGLYSFNESTAKFTLRNYAFPHGTSEFFFNLGEERYLIRIRLNGIHAEGTTDIPYSFAVFEQLYILES